MLDAIMESIVAKAKLHLRNASAVKLSVHDCMNSCFHN